MPEPILQLDNVEKTYGTPAATESRPVLSRISLQVMAGETLSIVGPSGSGKSTLLNIMGALDTPTRGSVKLKNRSYAALEEKELAHLRNREIGFVFQLHHLLPQCTVLENVLVPTLPAGDRENDAEARGRDLLERVGLGHRMNYTPGQLSGGERMRTALVRALINAPSLLLADEPTGSVDQTTADRLIELLAELNREENVTVVMVTHAANLAKRMQRQFRLAEGKLEEIDDAPGGT